MSLSPRLLWSGAVGVLGVGLALVFAAVLARGLFLPGVVLIDAGLVLLAGAALYTLLRAPGAT